MQLLRSTLLLLFFMHPKYALELFSCKTPTENHINKKQDSQHKLYTQVKPFQQDYYLPMTKIKVFLQFLQLILLKACLTRKILQPICYSPCPPPSSLQQHEWPQITVQHTLYTTTPCIVFVYQELTTCLCLLHLALNCPNPPLVDSKYARRSLCMLVAWLPTLHSSIHCHADTTVCMFVHSIHIKKGHGINMFNYPFIQITVQQNILSKRLRCFVKLKNKALPLLITRIQQRNTCH